MGRGRRMGAFRIHPVLLTCGPALRSLRQLLRTLDVYRLPAAYASPTVLSDRAIT